MTGRCVPITTTGDDGEPLHFRAQVRGDLTDTDRDMLAELARAAVRFHAAQPDCPNDPSCGHKARLHRDGACVVRRPVPCGCGGAA